jgi:hypothetical protein
MDQNPYFFIEDWKKFWIRIRKKELLIRKTDFN